MTRRRLHLSAACVVALVAAAFAIVAILPDNRSGLTRANFNSIEYGMSRADVVTIIGRDFDLNYLSDDEVDENGWPRTLHCWDMIHENDEGVLLLDFDKDGRVRGKQFVNTMGFFQRVCRWLHLL